MRRANLALVLGAVAARQGTTRAGAAATTGLTKATVSAQVDRLIRAGLVREGGLTATTRPGRPGTTLALSERGPVGVGVEIGVHFLAVAVVGMGGDVLERSRRERDHRDRSAAQVLSTVAATLRRMLDRFEADGRVVGGVGVAVPGLVDAGSGLLRVAPNLGWRDIPVHDDLVARLDSRVPVTVANEANLAALGELWFGGHDDLTDFLFVSGEVGVGGGLVVGGRLFEGVRGFSGEIGHVVVDPNGPRCRCGSRGCLERVAGQDRVLRDAGVRNGDVGGGMNDDAAVDRLVELLTAGDRRALEAVATTGRWLGTAAAAVVNVTDLPTVVLGGLYARLEPWLRPALTATLDRTVLSASWAAPRVAAARLGREAAVRGAAGRVVRAILAEPEDFVAAAEQAG